MSGHASKNIDAATLWGGKISPFSTSYGKLMMWFFLISDALTFGGLLTAYGFIRHSFTGTWPVGEKVFHHFPGMGETPMPLAYVAFMTFILIVSSVTMVLAVEAGHRNNRRGVTKWLLLTVVGGLIFLLSQVWEWSHFIHGSHFGKVQLADNSWANVEGEFGEIEYLKLVPSGDHHGHHAVAVAHDHHGDDHESHDSITGDHALHMYKHALAFGHLHGNILTDDETQLQYEVHKKDDKVEKLTIMMSGEEFSAGQEITGEKAQAAYDEVIASGTTSRVVFGADLKDNEYGPVQYGQFFFFITGFHGFHVFSGVLINLIILFQVLGGVMERRGHYEMVEKVGLYWHFVDLVWVFVFTFFYLI